MDARHDLRNAPPYLSFRLAEKKDSAAPGARKKRALRAGNAVTSDKPGARNYPTGVLVQKGFRTDLWQRKTRRTV